MCHIKKHIFHVKSWFLMKGISCQCYYFLNINTFLAPPPQPRNVLWGSKKFSRFAPNISFLPPSNKMSSCAPDAEVCLPNQTILENIQMKTLVLY